jgi:hypothetical protein
MRRAEVIGYHDPADGRLLATSEALLSGAYRHSQVHVRYETGLEVWVNGSLTEAWLVEAGGETYRLPPSGFVARGPEGLLVYSAQTDAGRVDFATYGDTRFIDARGRRQTVGPFDTDGAALLRRNANETWTLWPLGRLGVLRLRAEALGLSGDVVARPFADPGEPLPPTAAQIIDGWLLVPTGEGDFCVGLGRG